MEDQLTQLMLLTILCALATGATDCFQPDTYTYLTLDPGSAEPTSLTLLASPPQDTAPRLPNGRSPALVFVHGGYWSSGNSADLGLTNDMQDANEKGYFAVSINYRLTAENAEDGTAKHPWPAQIQDVKCAVRWVRAQADDFNIDPERVAVVGVSSGGHLALMAGEATDLDSFEAADCSYPGSSTPNAVVSYAGVGDIMPFWELAGGKTSLVRLLGYPKSPLPELADIQEDLDWVNPLTYVQSSSAVPVLLMHAKNDGVVPCQASENLFEKLEDENRDAYFFVTETGDHTFTGVRDTMDDVMHAWLGERFWGVPSGLPDSHGTTCD